ncbi:DinB family protein [Streptomyces parvulus]
MDHDQRTPPSKVAGDRESFTSFLDHQRATPAQKCRGLTGDQLRRRAVPTSVLTLLGLVRHAASVERSWFGFALGAEDFRDLWPGEADGFRVEGADADQAFGVWREECDHSRAVASSFASLDDTVECGSVTISLRYVLTHMIEEYARHNGHADLLREAIDGTVGE